MIRQFWSLFSIPSRNLHESSRFRAVLVPTLLSLSLFFGFSVSALAQTDSAPIFTTQPTGKTAIEGQTATFTAAASGNPVPTFQWERLISSAWTPIAGATSASYTTPPTVVGDNGAQFRVVAKNTSGSIISSAVPSTVYYITITARPTGFTAPVGTTATYKVVATGNPSALTYQWCRRAPGGTTFVAIPGATGSIYTTPPVVIGDNGARYLVKVSNVSLTKDSDSAILIVTDVPVAPAFTTQPTGKTVNEGQTATFTAAASGNPAPTFQWQKLQVSGTWTPIAGATSTSYTTPPTVPGDNGAQFRVVTTNTYGSVTSMAAPLTVNFITIIARPTGITAHPGDTPRYCVVAAGNPATLSYQWYRRAPGGTVFVAIPGATGPCYTLPPVVIGDNGARYFVRVSNAAPLTKDSDSAILMVTPVPAVSVSVSPVSATLNTSAKQTFTATVTGSSNTAVNWTCTSGTITAGGLYTAPAIAGTYRVRATSQADSTKYAEATVAVKTPILLSVTSLSRYMALRWNVPQNTPLNILRSLDSVSFTQIGSALAGDTIYEDKNVSPRTTYYYRVENGATSSTIGHATTTLLLNESSSSPSAPVINKPGYLVINHDSLSNVAVTRIADNRGNSITASADSGSGKWGSSARHHYSTDQPWNLDQSLFLMTNGDGGADPSSLYDTYPSSLYLDGTNYAVKYLGKAVPGFPSESSRLNLENSLIAPRWLLNSGYSELTEIVSKLTKTPNAVLVGMQKGKLDHDYLVWLNVPDNTVLKYLELPFHADGMGHGYLSFDGRYAVIQETPIESGRAVVVDMKTWVVCNKIQQLKDAATAGYDAGAACMSASGKYVIVTYDKEGTSLTRVFTVNADLSLVPKANDKVINSSQQTGIPESIVDGSQGFVFTVGHFDIALDPKTQEDVIVGVNSCYWDAQVNGVYINPSLGEIGNVVMVQLSDGKVTNLMPKLGTRVTPGVQHVSTRNFALPGWAFIDFYPTLTPKQTDPYGYCNQLVALKLDGSGTIERIAYVRSDSKSSSDDDINYYAEPHCVPSPDGTRVVGASNWMINGVGGIADNPQDYVFDLR